MNFWDRLKASIKTQNTTQEWVATQIGVLPQTFRRWSANKTIPDAEQAYAIAKTLGVTVEFLVTGSDPDAKTLGPNAMLIKRSLYLLPDTELADIAFLLDTKTKKLEPRSSDFSNMLRTDVS